MDRIAILVPAVQIVQLHHQEIWLNIVKELFRLQVIRHIVLILNMMNMLQIVEVFLTVDRVQEHHLGVRLLLSITDEQLANAHYGDAISEDLADLRHYWVL